MARLLGPVPAARIARSPSMLPIPGTSSVAHLEDNLLGATIELNDSEFEALSAIGV